MFTKPEVLTIASSLSAHAAARQALIAENVANADTPGYRAKDIGGFAASYRDALGTEMRQSRPGHVGNDRGFDGGADGIVSLAKMSPNGNSVSLESEMVKSAEVEREHNLALAIYGKSLDILRASLGRR